MLLQLSLIGDIILLHYLERLVSIWIALQNLLSLKLKDNIKVYANFQKRAAFLTVRSQTLYLKVLVELHMIL